MWIYSRSINIIEYKEIVFESANTSGGDGIKSYIVSDSVERQYLWMVLSAFNIDPVFTKWVKLLYTDSREKAKMYERVSECFSLFLGMRQGCPLSPLLFALVEENLAIAIRATGEVKGFRRGVDEEKISLYVDNVLLFLGYVNQSLTKAMDIIERFGVFSGLSINWKKSVLLPVDAREC